MIYFLLHPWSAKRNKLNERQMQIVNFSRNVNFETVEPISTIICNVISYNLEIINLFVKPQNTKNCKFLNVKIKNGSKTWPRGQRFLFY